MSGDVSMLEDSVLVEALGGPGWAEALGTLWTRHMDVLWNAARATTRNDQDAQDAISDAFVNLATRAADGRLEVQASFRALAITVVRNAAVGRHRKVHREDLADQPIEAMAEDGGPLPADRFVADADAAMIAVAFASLPERSRTVLWLTEVEGLPPREVAEIVGMSANNVAQVSVRSRRSLRTAWVQRHLSLTPVDPLCAEMQALLPAAITNDLAPAARARLDAHLAECPECEAVRVELTDDTAKLRGLIIPPIIGLTGVAIWLAKAKSAAALEPSPTPLSVGKLSIRDPDGSGLEAPIDHDPYADAIEPPTATSRLRNWGSPARPSYWVGGITLAGIAALGIVGVGIARSGEGKQSPLARTATSQARTPPTAAPTTSTSAPPVEVTQDETDVSRVGAPMPEQVPQPDVTPAEPPPPPAQQVMVINTGYITVTADGITTSGPNYLVQNCPATAHARVFVELTNGIYEESEIDMVIDVPTRFLVAGVPVKFYYSRNGVSCRAGGGNDF